MLKLHVHTIFILRENILFLEEWLHYHILLGVDHFYLYDNSKSIGRNGSTPTTNKYNYNFVELTSHLSDTDVTNMRDSILEKYKKHITYVHWEPKDEKGNVWYGSREAMITHITQNRNEDTWTAFIDTDEFIYSKGPLKNLVSDLDSKGYSNIVLYQKKFDDRFNNLSKPVTQITDCIEGLDTTGWSPKHIIKNTAFNYKKSYKKWDIHNLPLYWLASIYKAPIKELRFNHYNVNSIQLEWMKSFYKRSTDFKLNGHCHELLNAYNAMKQKES